MRTNFQKNVLKEQGENLQIEIFFIQIRILFNNGNLIQDNNYYYEYNSFNQLIRIREGDSTGFILEEYSYDQDNNRVKKQDNINNETTFYINENFIEKVNSTGTYNEIYYYHDDTLIARKESSKVYFYHPDHLGSTTLITNSTGGKEEETNYKPYGEPLYNDDSSRFLYTGKELDDIGLYYDGARYYNPGFTRFIQPDSLIPDIYNPQSLNRYSYVLNNPYKYVDPTGREPIVSELIGYNSVINQIRQIEQAHPDYNARQTLITFNYRSAAPTDSGKSFIYTSDKGFIDNQHFFANAKVGAVSAELGGSAGINALISGAVAIGGGYAVELGQGIGVSRLGGKESTFSYEDLSSNTLGAAFGSTLNTKQSLSGQYSSFISGLGGSNDPLTDISSSVRGTIPNTRADATSGTYLPDYKQKYSPFGKALPKDQNKQSFSSRFKNYFSRNRR